MRYFTIQHYNVPKGFSMPEDELERLNAKFFSKYVAAPIERMKIAEFYMRFKYEDEPEMKQEREDFIRWYMYRYSEDTQWGKKFTGLMPKFFPVEGERYL
jgi:hypothetical protein